MGGAADDEPYSAHAISVRESVERCLSEPRQAWHTATDTYSWEPAVCEVFHLDAVQLSGSRESPIIDVLFRWDSLPERFGISYPINSRNPAPDAYISIYVDEDLLAMGRGVEDARRKAEHGITWLSWPGSSCLTH